MEKKVEEAKKETELNYQSIKDISTPNNEYLKNSASRIEDENCTLFFYPYDERLISSSSDENILKAVHEVVEELIEEIDTNVKDRLIIGSTLIKNSENIKKILKENTTNESQPVCVLRMLIYLTVKSEQKLVTRPFQNRFFYGRETVMKIRINKPGLNPYINCINMLQVYSHDYICELYECDLRNKCIVVPDYSSNLLLCELLQLPRYRNKVIKQIIKLAYYLQSLKIDSYEILAEYLLFETRNCNTKLRIKFFDFTHCKRGIGVLNRRSARSLLHSIKSILMKDSSLSSRLDLEEEESLNLAVFKNLTQEHISFVFDDICPLNDFKTIAKNLKILDDESKYLLIICVLSRYIQYESNYKSPSILKKIAFLLV